MTLKIKKLKINYKEQKLEIEYFLRLGFKETLLYLHGGACYKNDFLEATKIPTFNDYTIIAFDFPGCGNSTYSKDQNLNIDDLVEITHLIIKKLNLNNIVLIGHSMGGLVGLLYVLKYNHIKAFIDIEGNLTSENCVFSRQVSNCSVHEYKNILNQLTQNLKNSGNKGLKEWSKTIEKYSDPKAFLHYCYQIVDYSDNGKLVVDERFLNLIVDIANGKFLKGRKKLERLEREIRKLQN